MRKTLRHPPLTRLGERAFALVGVLALLVILAVAASIAVQSLEPAIDETKRVETEAEMDLIAHAIAGEYSLSGSLSGSDFGYVGDVGALPVSLTNLTTNPGGYTTWDGPYIRDNFQEASGEFQNDAWGTPYVYTGGVTVQSTGSGSTLIHSIAATGADLLTCSFSGIVLGADRSTPGVCSLNVVAVVTYPNGIGGMTRDTSAVGGTGNFSFSGIPIGIHTVTAIDTIGLDSVESFIRILPRSTAANTSTGAMRLPTSTLCAGGGGGGGGGLTLVTGSDFPHGGACDHFHFTIENTSGANITLTSLSATWGTPTAYYGRIQWAGNDIFNSTNPRSASGDLSVFTSPQTITNGSQIEIKIRDFNTIQSGGGSSVAMDNVSLTILLSDGSSIILNLGACVP